MSDPGETGALNLANTSSELLPGDTGEKQGTTDNKAVDKSRQVKIAKYVKEIELYAREARNWMERAKKINRRYKDERSAAENNVARYNVLWANTQTQMPALYARNPKPDIQRRFKDADPVGRVSSDVLERTVTYFVDSDEFSAIMRAAVLDYKLGGRGTVWARYEPIMRKADVQLTDDAEEGQETEAQEVIDFEHVRTDYVNPEDFGHNICRTWDEVYCGWRKVFMTREELVKRFDARGKLPPLDAKQKDSHDNPMDNGVQKATIYELWDKNEKCAIWFHKDIPDSLDYRDDPLELDGFFPFPKPLYATLANDSLIPTPDYVEYQDQANELDSLTGRIASITKSLKVAGVYDASASGIGRILSEGVENQLIPIENWALLGEKGGLDGVISMLPLEKIAEALTSLYAAREQVKNDLYEITGIADIVRGESEPEETLGAQQIKSQFATQRISDQQREVQRFARGMIRIMVDIICGHFQIETIKEISGIRLMTDAEKMIYSPQSSAGMAGTPPPGSVQPGVQPGTAPAPAPPPLPKNVSPDQLLQMLSDPSWEDVEKLIRNNALRSFRIDIETDSTIRADEEMEKATRMEFLKSIGTLVEQVENAPPQMLPFLAQAVMFAVRAFPVGKELEGAMNALIQQLEKQAQNPQQKPDPEMLKVQGQMQLDQAKMQGEQQLASAKMQSEAQLQQQKVQGDMALEKAKLDAKVASDQSEAQQAMLTDQRENEMEAAREHAKLQQEERIAMAKIASETDLQLKIAHIKAAASIEVARITAKYDKGDEAEAREASGE